MLKLYKPFTQIEKKNIRNVSLLKFDNYETIKDIVPNASIPWWTRTSGSNNFKVLICGDKKISEMSCCDYAGVRPVIYLQGVFFDDGEIGSKVKIGFHNGTIISNEKVLFDEAVCLSIFDETCSQFETSYLKDYLDSSLFLDKIYNTK